MAFPVSSRRRRAVGWLAFGFLGLACSSSESTDSLFGIGELNPGADGSTEARDGANGGGNGSDEDGSVQTIGGGDQDGSAVTTGDAFAACATESAQATRLPLDLYIMLDSSGSMTELASNGVTKFSAVRTAIESFVGAPGASGLGVGLQYFPLRKKNVPALCQNDAECNTGGPCLTKVCFGGSESARACTTDSQCPQGACRSTGTCANNRNIFCSPPGQTCVVNGQNQGTCEARSHCAAPWSCATVDYATPAVAIAPLPGAKQAILTSLAAANPDGYTPTSAALLGAIAQSQSYATANPSHTVVAVLATDGLPTECDTDTDRIAKIAEDGFVGKPAVKTFVIGVFTQQQAATAKPILDKIAKSGGTSAAFIITTSSNVSQQFLNALDAIRGSQLPCEYAIPRPTNGQAVDYTKVNVVQTVAGVESSLPYAGSEAGCSGGAGWYYDVDPTTAVPTRIRACPSTCTALGNEGALKLVFGCQTVVK